MPGHTRKIGQTSADILKTMGYFRRRIWIKSASVFQMAVNQSDPMCRGFFWKLFGERPNSSRKHLEKYPGSLNPTL